MRTALTFLAGTVVGAAIVLGLLQLVELSGPESVVDWPTTISAAADIAQILALIAAGWWTYRLFIKQRVDRRRVDVSLQGDFAGRDDATQLLRVVLEIKNVGHVELEPETAEVIVSEVVRDRSLLPDPLTSGTDADKAAEKRVESWPELAKGVISLKEDELTLEPGECERYSLDFLLPIAPSVVQVRAKVHLGNSLWDEAILCSARAGS